MRHGPSRAVQVLAHSNAGEVAYFGTEVQQRRTPEVTLCAEHPNVPATIVSLFRHVSVHGWIHSAGMAPSESTLGKSPWKCHGVTISSPVYF